LNTIILVGAMIAPIPHPFAPPVVRPPVARVRPYVPYVAPNPVIIPPPVILPKKEEK
jgi:hypothetical protein